MSKNQSGDAYQVVIDSADHFADQQGAVGVGELASKDQADHIDLASVPLRKPLSLLHRSSPPAPG